jgi:hypothetical protein
MQRGKAFRKASHEELNDIALTARKCNKTIYTLNTALHKKSQTWLFSLRALRISVAFALKMGH